MNKNVIWAIFLALMLGRVFITPRLTGIPSVEGSYEALAHLVDGALLAAPLYDWRQKLGPSHVYGVLGCVLALWELGWFLAQRYG